MKISLCLDSGLHRWGDTFSPQHKRYYAITDAMCAEHDWFTAGTVSYKFAFDKISENFVEIYMKILNFGKLLKNYIT